MTLDLHYNTSSRFMLHSIHYTHLYLYTCTVTSIGIKQQYQKFHDLGAVDLHMEIEEVGPMGGDNNMAYDRGYIQVLNAQHNVMINGK